MSYILDALRRADAERERGAVPGLHAQPLPGAPLPGAGQRPAWVWGAAVAGGLLILGLCAAVWWLWQRGPTTPATGPAVRVAAADPQAAAPASAAPPVTAPAAGLEASATAPTQLPTQPAAASPATAAPARPPVTPNLPARPVTPPAERTTSPAGQTDREKPAARSPREDEAPTQARSQARSKATSDNEASAAPAATPAPRQPAPSPKPPAESTTSPERRIYPVDELPREIRTTLPAVAISGSIYSEDAASRFLMVNGEVVREGGRLGPDLVLEQIQPKSAVLRYKGYRYRVRF
jgi:general secretion pathway protein B